MFILFRKYKCANFMKIIHILILEGGEKRAEDKEAKGMKVTKCNKYKCNKFNKKSRYLKLVVLSCVVLVKV